jgi:1-acyl-sn-glycerol-3-phosphate acyltransferase
MQAAEQNSQPKTQNEVSPRDKFFARYRDDEDSFGFDLNKCKESEVLFRFLYEKWFGVTMVGLENIPAEGRAVLFGNHSGVLPVDGMMLYDGILNHHPAPRRIRFLVNEFIRKSPGLGTVIRGFGGVAADYELSKRLLETEELVCFYPEAEAGTGKLFKDRYRLREFHQGFVRGAIETNSPLVPIITIGGDEIYPLLANLKPVADLMGAPYWPVTPFYPLLPFPFNAIPLPVKLLICVGKPFKLDYAPENAQDYNLTTQIAHNIRQDIQHQINDLLAMRKSPFSKWDVEKVESYMRGIAESVEEIR